METRWYGKDSIRHGEEGITKATVLSMNGHWCIIPTVIFATFLHQIEVFSFNSCKNFSKFPLSQDVTQFEPFAIQRTPFTSPGGPIQWFGETRRSKTVQRQLVALVTNVLIWCCPVTSPGVGSVPKCKTSFFLKVHTQEKAFGKRGETSKWVSTNGWGGGLVRVWLNVRGAVSWPQALSKPKCQKIVVESDSSKPGQPPYWCGTQDNWNSKCYSENEAKLHGSILRKRSN